MAGRELGQTAFDFAGLAGDGKAKLTVRAGVFINRQVQDGAVVRKANSRIMSWNLDFFIGTEPVEHLSPELADSATSSSSGSSVLLSRWSVLSLCPAHSAMKRAAGCGGHPDNLQIKLGAAFELGFHIAQYGRITFSPGKPLSNSEPGPARGSAVRFLEVLHAVFRPCSCSNTIRGRDEGSTT